MPFKSMLHKRSGRKFKKVRANTRWVDNPQFTSYIDQSISRAHETGVHGAIRAATGDVPLGRGVSVGAGDGAKEIALIAAGLIKEFDLFEVSADRVEQSKQKAAVAGLSGHLNSRLEDAFTHDFEGEYDLVYWEHALHHMFDVDHAVAWSVRALKPGGLLVINDYIGPTRLQWRPNEVEMVRQFLRDHAEILGVDPKRVKLGTPFRRLKQAYRDPSEAPQSDKIEAAYKRHTGEDLNILGGAMIHLGGGFLTGSEDQDPDIHDRLILLDQKARDQGISHFAFGLWQKPDQAGMPFKDQDPSAP
ncbi:MAG: methyltransferase domain-containing protein [Pseudomonadota bacterium]